MHSVYDPAALKKPVDLSIHADLLNKARALEINLSAPLETALAAEVKRRRAASGCATTKRRPMPKRVCRKARRIQRRAARVLGAAMAQLSVYRNKNRRTKGNITFFLNVQSDWLGHLDTRVVVPLATAKSFGGPPSESLKPVFEPGGEKHMLLTPLLAGGSKKELGAEVHGLR